MSAPAEVSISGNSFISANSTIANPEELWKQYIVLTEVEQAFKYLVAISLRIA